MCTAFGICQGAGEDIFTHEDDVQPAMPQQQGSAAYGEESREREVKDTRIAENLPLEEIGPVAPNALSKRGNHLEARNSDGDETSERTIRENDVQKACPSVHVSNDSPQTPTQENDLHLDPPSALACPGEVREGPHRTSSIPSTAAGNLSKKRIDAAGGLIDAPRQRDIASFFGPKLALSKPPDLATSPKETEDAFARNSEPEGSAEAEYGAVQAQVPDTEEKNTEEHDDEERNDEGLDKDEADYEGTDKTGNTENKEPIDRAAKYRALIANESKAEKLRRKVRISH